MEIELFDAPNNISIQNISFQAEAKEKEANSCKAEERRKGGLKSEYERKYSDKKIKKQGEKPSTSKSIQFKNSK